VWKRLRVSAWSSSDRYAVIAAAEVAAAVRWNRNANGGDSNIASMGVPVDGSCLYNSMLHPLLSLPVAGILWYQVRQCLRVGAK
jgi:hypothetical protein